MTICKLVAQDVGSLAVIVCLLRSLLAPNVSRKCPLFAGPGVTVCEPLQVGDGGNTNLIRHAEKVISNIIAAIQPRKYGRYTLYLASLIDVHQPDFQIGCKTGNTCATSSRCNHSGCAVGKHGAHTIFARFLCQKFRRSEIFGDEMSHTLRFKNSHCICHQPPRATCDHRSRTADPPRKILKNVVRAFCFERLRRAFHKTAAECLSKRFQPRFSAALASARSTSMAFRRDAHSHGAVESEIVVGQIWPPRPR